MDRRHLTPKFSDCPAPAPDRMPLGCLIPSCSEALQVSPPPPPPPSSSGITSPQERIPLPKVYLLLTHFPSFPFISRTEAAAATPQEPRPINKYGSGLTVLSPSRLILSLPATLPAPRRLPVHSGLTGNGGGPRVLPKALSLPDTLCPPWLPVLTLPAIVTLMQLG